MPRKKESDSVSDLDFSFAWEGAAGPSSPWQHLRVAGFRGTEGISCLYRYEITAITREPAPEVDPDELIQARATLRIATGTLPAFRVVHGILTEVEELGPIHGGMAYRLVVEPPLARAAHRTRCRVFLEKTTRQIIDAVLQGDPALQRADDAAAEPDDGLGDFSPARELFAWRVADTSRIDAVAARRNCVQYNESDLAFVSRLLEEEGIGYHFENGSGVCLLVLSDRDTGRTRIGPFLPLGPNLRGREVTTMKLGARLRPRRVTLQDYNWKKPALSMAVQEDAGGGDLVEHEYPGRYPDTPDQGRPLAAARRERLEVEASYAVGVGPSRVLAAGTIFALEHTSARHEGEYLVTRMDVRGEQPGVLPPSSNMNATQDVVPYAGTFECARRGKAASVAESRFRPARLTPKPRIVGSQTAFVTAEPSAPGKEIHVGGPPGAAIGCVRLRFHWDEDTARHGKEPTSCWVRVSQVFAGAGQGAVFHPRVGAEVIVDFEDGDPDRPLVVGRVYNGQNVPPTVVPTVSTLKTDTSPGGGTHNELLFDDTAGAQQILLHTPKDWNCEVGNNRSETIAVDSSSSVGANRSEATGADRSTLVGANNAEVVGANETVTVGGNQTIGVGGDQDTSVGGNQSVGVQGDQSVGVQGNRSVGVEGDQSVTISGNRNFGVKGDSTETVTGNRTVEVTADEELSVAGKQSIHVVGDQETTYDANHELFVKKKQEVHVDGEQVTVVKGQQRIESKTEQVIEAPTQQINAETTQVLNSDTFHADARRLAAIGAPTVVLQANDEMRLSGATLGAKLVISFDGDIAITGKKISLEASEITLKGGSSVTVEGGEQVDVKAALIKLN
ncbi:type VI secretion system Vgr family protein [Sorangium sp. So ce887]|uniref:type VI secretion system Vgr family protein n=1 Tax=Sorangium sp. So ce887 TaxID=3133324 RepID=UPI003F606B41